MEDARSLAFFRHELFDSYAHVWYTSVGVLSQVYCGGLQSTRKMWIADQGIHACSRPSLFVGEMSNSCRLRTGGSPTKRCARVPDHLVCIWPSSGVVRGARGGQRCAPPPAGALSSSCITLTSSFWMRLAFLPVHPWRPWTLRPWRSCQPSRGRPASQSQGPLHPHLRRLRLNHHPTP